MVKLGSKKSLSPAQHQTIRGPSGPERSCAELAVLENLSVADRDGASLRPLHGEPQPADQVLAEVQQRLAAGSDPDALRSHRLVAADGGVLGAVEPGGVEVQLAGADPGGRFDPACVDGLAVVQVVGRDAGSPCLPRRVGPDDHGGAVGVLDLQLGEGAGLASVQVAVAVEAEATAVPTAAHVQPYLGVGLHEVGDVVAPVAEAPLVARPARRQHLVADRSAVHARLDHAEGRHVQGGPSRLAREADSSTEDGCSVEVGVRGDHPGGPADLLGGQLLGERYDAAHGGAHRVSRARRGCPRPSRRRTR